MMFGTVKRLVREKGFGFIRTTDGVEWFFHRSEAREFDTMTEGNRVTFQETEGTKGPRAVGVERVEA